MEVYNEFFLQEPILLNKLNLLSNMKPVHVKKPLQTTQNRTLAYTSRAVVLNVDSMAAHQRLM